jgi:hypothetical protein
MISNANKEIIRAIASDYATEIHASQTTQQEIMKLLKFTPEEQQFFLGKLLGRLAVLYGMDREYDLEIGAGWGNLSEVGLEECDSSAVDDYEDEDDDTSGEIADPSDYEDEDADRDINEG